jgi:glycosyltransferase involved in cell wall biosynthesis
VVVAGKVPPPVGGQNINIDRVLGLLSDTSEVEPVYWEWAFNQDWRSRKRVGTGKLLALIESMLRLIRIRSQGRVDWVLYSTGGPDLVPILRDVVLLPLSWVLARRVCVYFQAAGIANSQVNLPWWLNWLNRQIHKLCWGAVVITEYGKADPMALGIERIAVIPYGIEDHYIESTPKPNPVPILLNAGHICADKGIPQLIAACGRLKHSGREFKLWLAGEGLLPYSLTQLNLDINKAGLKDHVRILGLLRGEELWDVYRSADLFVFSSIAPYESFGLVLLEAMMMGLPAVVTDWRANADVLGREAPGGGIISAPVGPATLEAQLEEALGRALESQHLWASWGMRNRQRYLANHTIEVYRSRLETYFCQDPTGQAS